MDNKEIIRKVEEYQNCGYVHSLTCGNDSKHRNLVAKVMNSTVVLICLDCDYVQSNIPEHVLRPNLSAFVEKKLLLGKITHIYDSHLIRLVTEVWPLGDTYVLECTFWAINNYLGQPLNDLKDFSPRGLVPEVVVRVKLREDTAEPTIKNIYPIFFNE
jgi:hypothetical protein